MLGKRLLRGCLLGVHRGETSSKNKRLIPQSNFKARYQLLWQGNQYWWGCWKDVRWHTSYSRSPGREGINEKLQLPNHHYFLYNKIKIKIKINFFFILCVIIPSRKIHIVCGMFFRTFSHSIHQGLASNPCPSILYSLHLVRVKVQLEIQHGHQQSQNFVIYLAQSRVGSSQRSYVKLDPSFALTFAN